MAKSFFHQLQQTLNQVNDNEFITCLKFISSQMKFAISFNNQEKTRHVNINNCHEYEAQLGVKLYSIKIKSFAELEKLACPIILKINNDNKLFVHVKSCYNKIVLYNASSHQYEKYPIDCNHLISDAWQCYPVYLPVISDYVSLLKWMGTYFKRDIFLMILPGLSASGMILLGSLISGYVFKHLNQFDQAGISSIFIAFMLILLSGGMMSYFNSNQIRCLNLKAVNFIMMSIAYHLYYLPLQVIREYSSGDLLQRLSDYELALSELIYKSMSLIFNSISMIILLAYITYCNSWISVICIVAGFVFTLARLILLSFNHHYISIQMREQGRVNSFLNEVLLQIHKIRSANAENEIFIDWWNRLINLKMQAESSIKIQILNESAGTIIPAFVILCLYGVLYASVSQTDSWFLLQLVICVGIFAGSLEQVSSDIFSLLYYMPALKSLKKIIHESNIIKESNHSISKLNGEITFAHITLKDDAGKRLILNNISFHIETGKLIAFVGRSGAGKSSLFKLLLGLCRENSGDIKIDNHLIDHLNMNHLRKQIGVVLQNTSLLPGSIYSNISANANISMDETWELAECVGLDEEIKQMPMKMLTHITDNAAESISGGQKQKILIARALASKPKILLLDEATSSLDNQSQYRVYQHLKTLNITRIIIAHRISTIQDADRIYVMDQGCIIDSGTYAELADKSDLLV